MVAAVDNDRSVIDATEQKVRFLVNWFERLKAERENWDDIWQDASDLLALGGQFNASREGGYDQHRRLYDSTAPKAVVKVAGAFHGLLTNPATKWFNLNHPDPDINKSPRARRWMDDRVLDMLRFFGSTRFNFNTQSQEVYLGLIGYGTQPMVFNEEPARLRFAARPLSECYLSPDADGNVEAVFRCFKMSKRHMVEHFGESCHKTVKDDVERGNHPDDRLDILHATYPRTARDPLNYSASNKRVASCYIDVTHSKLLRESGFDRMPFLTPRFFKEPGQVYGWGPGTMMLADVGMLNEFRRTHIMSLELAVAPPLVAQANSVEGPIRTAPLSITYTRAGSADPIKPLYTGVRPDLGKDALAEMRDEIRQGFFLDILTLPEIDRMTTVEVMQRVQQKMTFISPMLSRITDEYLGPLVYGTFAYMNGAGMFPKAPPEMRGAVLGVEFQSVMALSQRLGEANAAQQWIAGLAPLAQADPSILDWIDTDELAQTSGTGWYGVPQRLLRSKQTVERIRVNRMRQLAAQAQAQQALTMAQAAESGTKAIANVRAA